MKRDQLKSFILAINLVSSVALARSPLPAWITGGPTSDAQHLYVVCSHDAIDPEDARQIAETKCLASAAKLGGVTVNIKEKTVQSTTGADSSEVAEIVPLRRNIKCTWTDRLLEPMDFGYRVWLRCGILKNQVTLNKDDSQIEAPSAKVLPYKRGLLTVGSVPPADIILVGGSNGERVIEPTSNIEQVELREGDEWVTVKKRKFVEQKQKIGQWSHGATPVLNFILQRGL